MSIIKSKKALLIAALTVFGAIAAGTSAFALFTTSGTAHADVKSGTIVALTGGTATMTYVTGESSLWPNLDASGNVPAYPQWGAHVATVSITVTNPNLVKVRITGADLSATFTDGAYAGCAQFVHALASPTIAGGNVIIDPNQAATFVVTGVYLDTTAPDVCQSQTFGSIWTIDATAL